MRKMVLAGNWKMHKTQAELEGFINTFLETSGYQGQTGIEALISPPFTMLERAQTLCASKGIAIAAQNCHEEESGAFTGEVSIPMLKEISIASVIIGHSERRQYFSETDQSVASKVRACLDSGLRPILCVGESKEEREAGDTEKVLERQVNAVLEMVPDLKDTIIAYEPVWAIGTGLTASEDEAEAAHKFIRGLVAKKDSQSATKMPILYGGSVKPGNIAGLLKQENVDGALIGGASLKPEDFGAIVETAIASL